MTDSYPEKMKISKTNISASKCDSYIDLLVTIDKGKFMINSSEQFRKNRVEKEAAFKSDIKI